MPAGWNYSGPLVAHAFPAWRRTCLLRKSAGGQCRSYLKTQVLRQGMVARSPLAVRQARVLAYSSLRSKIRAQLVI